MNRLDNTNDRIKGRHSLTTLVLGGRGFHCFCKSEKRSHAPQKKMKCLLSDVSIVKLWVLDYQYVL